MPAKSLWKTPSILAGLPMLVLFAVGCDDVERMEIDSDSTTANPSSFERTIPEDAVDEGRETQ